ncbi:MAG: prolyl-tRNA synthetase associated domain-containing protein [bacterium]
MTPSELYHFLDEHQISYEKFDHSPVYTVEESKKLSPAMSGGKTKNLFVRDKKGKHHILLTVEQDKRVDLKKVSEFIGYGRLSFCSPERLLKYLGVEPGSVSLLGILNDQAGEVEILIDEDLWKEQYLLCHPLVNTSTLRLGREGLVKLFQLSGHPFRLLPIPELEE